MKIFYKYVIILHRDKEFINFCLIFFVGLQFVRVESFVFSHIADEGLMNACAGSLLRYAKNIGARDIVFLTDIKKKHW